MPLSSPTLDTFKKKELIDIGERPDIDDSPFDSTSILIAQMHLEVVSNYVSRRYVDDHNKYLAQFSASIPTRRILVQAWEAAKEILEHSCASEVQFHADFKDGFGSTHIYIRAE